MSSTRTSMRSNPSGAIPNRSPNRSNLAAASSSGGATHQTPEAYYVRRPDQENRIVFTLKKQLCQREIPADELLKLLQQGRTDLVQGFISKRGLPFAAYLVLSKAGSKAEFEFPPR